MPKVHPIERCILCGTITKPLIPSNYEDLVRTSNMVDDFNKECAVMKLKNPCLFFISAHGISDKNSDICYFLCSTCCRKLIQDFLNHLVRIRRNILFQKFDKIKEELRSCL